MNRYGTLEITTVIGCNIRCRACPQERLLSSYFQQDKYRTSKMSIETFKKCIDSLPDDIRIDFSGMAEPWLNSACSEMLSYPEVPIPKTGDFRNSHNGYTTESILEDA